MLRPKLEGSPGNGDCPGCLPVWAVSLWWTWVCVGDHSTDGCAGGCRTWCSQIAGSQHEPNSDRYLLCFRFYHSIFPPKANIALAIDANTRVWVAVGSVCLFECRGAWWAISVRWRDILGRNNSAAGSSMIISESLCLQWIDDGVNQSTWGIQTWGVDSSENLEWYSLASCNAPAWTSFLDWAKRNYFVKARDTYLMDLGEQARIFFVVDNLGLCFFHYHTLENNTSVLGGVSAVS